MPIEISEYENFRERLERSNIPTENAVDIENNLLILPMNYSLDDGIDVDFVWYARFSNQLFRELREKDVPVQFIGTGSEPQDVIVKALSPDIIDLLRKSRVEVKLEVVDTSDEIKTQTEASATTTVAFTEDAKHLKFSVDVFDAQTQLA